MTELNLAVVAATPMLAGLLPSDISVTALVEYCLIMALCSGIILCCLWLGTES